MRIERQNVMWLGEILRTWWVHQQKMWYFTDKKCEFNQDVIRWAPKGKCGRKPMGSAHDFLSQTLVKSQMFLLQVDEDLSKPTQFPFHPIFIIFSYVLKTKLVIWVIYCPTSQVEIIPSAPSGNHGNSGHLQHAPHKNQHSQAQELETRDVLFHQRQLPWAGRLGHGEANVV